MSKKVMWSLESGLDLARLVEGWADGAFHVGLAGSVLHTGKSMKDVDLIVYPHDGGDLDKSLVAKTLEANGFEQAPLTSEYPDGRVACYLFRGRRVDILLLD